MFIHFQRLAILYLPFAGAAIASSVGGLRPSTTPGLSSMNVVSHSTTPGPSSMVGVSRSAIRGPRFATVELSRSDRVNADIQYGKLSGISLEEFESWVDSTGHDIGAFRNMQRRPMFTMAAQGHRLDIAEFLIRRGLNVDNDNDLAGHTPLMAAVVSKDVDIIRLLLRNGADVNRDIHGKTALRVAIRTHSTELVELLIKEGGADVNLGEGAALVDAAQVGDIPIIDILLRSGADIQQVYHHLIDPLRAAACSRADNRDEVFDFLVQRGANVNRTNQIGTGGLENAALQGRCDIVEMYFRNGADIHVVDTWGKTLLMKAASKGHANVVEFLIQRGVDIEAVEIQRRSALDIARHQLALKPTHEGYKAVVRLIEDALAENATGYVFK